MDLVRSVGVATLEAEELRRANAAGEILSLDLARRVPRLWPGEFHYVRVVQRDGGVAWSSPVFAPIDPQTATDRGPEHGDGAPAAHGPVVPR